MEMYKTEWKLLKSSIAMDDPLWSSVQLDDFCTCNNAKCGTTFGKCAVNTMIATLAHKTVMCVCVTKSV